MIPIFKPFISPPEELMPALEETLYSGYISEGPKVREFEKAFGEFIGNPNVLAFSSGTAALHVALILAGVGPSDEVISTPMTAEPTNMAIKYTGAKIVWADVDPKNGNIDPFSARQKFTSRTKAVISVDYGGIPADISHKFLFFPVIEDAAHALGILRYGKQIYHPLTMFSLQAIKHLTTCDGGMLVVDPEQMEYARRLRFFGIDRQQLRENVDIPHVGYKYNMNDVTATIGLIQLHHAQWVIDRHIENGEYFNRELANVSGLELCRIPFGAQPSYWFYTVLAERRDDLSRKLTEAGIANGQVHRRNDWHSVFVDSKCDLPWLDWFWEHMLHIPCHWAVTPENREYIVKVIKGGW